MSQLKSRLGRLEEARLLREYQERYQDLRTRSDEDLEFFSAHRFWPEEMASEPLPKRKELVVRGIRTIVITERVEDEDMSRVASPRTGA